MKQAGLKAYIPFIFVRSYTTGISQKFSYQQYTGIQY